MICEKCGDLGYWFSDTGAMVICPCQIKKMLQSRKEAAGVTPLLQDQTFGNFDLSFYHADNLTKAETALNAAKCFCEDYIAERKVDGLLFLGAVGSGKTYLASAIANRIIDHNGIRGDSEAVKFVVIPDLLDQVRKSMKDSSSEREDLVIGSVKCAPLLILDDLGTDNNSDFAIRLIFSILNYRLNYGLPTIVTTNLAYKQIEEYYGSRICSRLAQLCKFYPLEAERDIRMAKKLRERN